MSDDEIEIRIDLPSNKKEDVVEKTEEVSLTAVTEPIRKERHGFKHIFRNLFSGGDIVAIFGLIGTSVILPAVKSMLLDSVTKGVEQALYGEDHSRYNQITRIGGGPVNYSSISTKGRGGAKIASPSIDNRNRRETDIWVLPSRGEAELVVESLKHQIEEYGQATVADYYELIGKTGSYTDNNWGWLDLSHVRISRVNGGYIINFPNARSL